MKRRHAILLLGGASSGAMSVGTGAFSSVDAERGVEVNVVEDDEAYLGIDVENRIATVDRPVEVVEITNSFTNTLSLDVTVEETNEVVDDVTVADGDPGDEFSLELGPGESEPVAITCGRLGSASFTLSFDGNTGGSSVEKTRMFDGIECLVSGVEFKGQSGNVVVKGDFTDLDVTVVFGSGTEVVRTISSEPGGTALHPRDGGEGGNDSIKRVAIGGTVFERP